MGSNTNWRLGSDTFNAPELSSLVLRSLKEDAEEFLQRPIKDVVISVPAYFSDEQRKHTRLAAELAGLNAVRLINEPTAAAMGVWPVIPNKIPVRWCLISVAARLTLRCLSTPRR